MIQIVAKDFLAAWSMFEVWRVLAGKKRGQIADERERQSLAQMLCDLNYQCYRLGLSGSRDRSKELLDWIHDPGNHRVYTKTGYSMPKEAPLPDFESVYKFLQNIGGKIHEELNSVQMALIPSDRTAFFERDDLFGGEVKQACSAKINEEIKNAGNCLAADLNTAAIFHLMRVSEFGMRALAIHLKVRLKNKPIEHGGWNELIEQIEMKVRVRREKYDKSRRKNKKELEFLKFCRMMADELYKFKEIWRNNTMHSISSYTESEAIGVFERVRDFMQRLEKRIPIQ